MTFSNESAIIQERNINDSTTGGTTVYQTADGRWWRKCEHSPVTEDIKSRHNLIVQPVEAIWQEIHE